jgi:phage baseplate assembly protein gpV
MKNEQSVATFNGFVYINNVTTAPAGDLTISNCNFRNCAGGAIRNYGTATHRLTVENCVFDGTKTVSVYAQSSTMFALDMATSGFSKGITVLRNCEFRNLFDTPIKLSSAEAFNVSIQGCTFSGNAGSQSINIAAAPTTAVLEIGNCVGDFTSNVPLINFSDDLDFRVNGWLKRWLPIIDDGVTNRYVEVPFVGPALVKAVLIANQNPGGSSFYRTIKEITASATYDYTSQLATRASIQDDFASASPTLGFNLNIQVAVTNVATGTTVNGVLSPGKLVLYWPRTYGDSSIDVQYVHSSVKPA